MVEQIAEIARKRIQLDVDEQLRKVETNIAQIRAQAAAHGVLGSSRTLLAVDAECAAAITARSRFVFDHLVRSVQMAGVAFSADLGAQLKELAFSFFPEGVDGLENRANNMFAGSGLQNAGMNNFQAAATARQEALKYLSAEIDLFIMSLTNKANTQAGSVTIQINNSTVGSVQAGDYSTANVNQAISQHEHNELIQALKQLKSEVAAISEFPGQDKTEVVEVLDDGVAELQKGKPNLTKVRGYLATIGAAISGTADVITKVGPAYEVVKKAATMIGVTLP
jgi:hypothetical protein